MILAVCSLMAGFYFNVLRRSSRFAQGMYWLSVVATVATLLEMGLVALVIALNIYLTQTL